MQAQVKEEEFKQLLREAEEKEAVPEPKKQNPPPLKVSRRIVEQSASDLSLADLVGRQDVLSHSIAKHLSAKKGSNYELLKEKLTATYHNTVYKITGRRPSVVQPSVEDLFQALIDNVERGADILEEKKQMLYTTKEEVIDYLITVNSEMEKLAADFGQGNQEVQELNGKIGTLEEGLTALAPKDKEYHQAMRALLKFEDSYKEAQRKQSLVVGAVSYKTEEIGFVYDIKESLNSMIDYAELLYQKQGQLRRTVEKIIGVFQGTSDFNEAAQRLVQDAQALCNYASQQVELLAKSASLGIRAMVSEYNNGPVTARLSEIVSPVIKDAVVTANEVRDAQHLRIEGWMSQPYQKKLAL